MPKNQKQVENTEEKTFSLISDEKLLAIYAAMLKCRLLEQRATALFQHGQLDSDLHVSSGLEATAAAIAIDLEQGDTLCLAPNDWLPGFVKGMSLDALFRCLAPSSLKSPGSTEIEAGHKNILFDSGSTDAQKTILDRALEASKTKNGAVAAVFIPSGASPLAQWQKNIQIAGTKRLPVIFVHYSESVDAAPYTSALKPEALVYGVPSIAVDARDPVAVYRVAYEAIVRARQLRGATLLECFIDSQPSSLGGANSREIQPAASDPIAAMQSYLKSKNIKPDIDNQELIAAFNRDLDLATRFLDK